MKKFESGAQKRKKIRLFEKAAQSQRGSIDHFIKKSDPYSDSIGTEIPGSLSPDASQPSVAVNLSLEENVIDEDMIAPSEGLSLPLAGAESNSLEDMPPLMDIARDGDIIPETDPALWNVSSDMVNYWLQIGPKSCANRDGIYANSLRKYVNSNRKLNDSAFYSQSHNGEKLERHWLLYAPSSGCVFCFVCKLFSINSKSALATTGFDSWSTMNRLEQHEQSSEHRCALTTYSTRLSKVKTLDKTISEEADKERHYWREVLKRVVSTVKFLTSRGLSLRGSSETFGRSDNGNFLGCLEYLAEYDSFLAGHIDKYGNAGRGTTSYLSSTTYEEFVGLMAKQVINVIVHEVKLAKYFSFSVDSTPDISHTDQLTFTVRYVRSDGQPVERFLKFVQISSHTGLHLFDTIVETFRDLEIDIKDCRGQTYDNASNMAGQYSGVQARIIGINRAASYIPCMAHSLNLSGVAAVDTCTEAVKFFGVVQKIYVFLSDSTYRWNLVKDAVRQSVVGTEKSALLPKRLSDTRWSAHAVALRSMSNHYKTYQSVLQEIGNNNLQKKETRAEAMNLAKTMDKLETVFLVCFWNIILERINDVSQLLQSEKTDLCIAAGLMKSLLQFLASQRNRFEFYRDKASELCLGKQFERKRARQPKRQADDSNEPAVVLTGEEMFKVETFYVIIDSIVTDLSRRIAAYKAIDERCYFFMPMMKTALQ